MPDFIPSSQLQILALKKNFYKDQVLKKEALLRKNSDVPMTLFENSSTVQPATWSEMQNELLSTYLKKSF